MSALKKKKKKQIQNDALVRAGLLLQHISN